MGIFRPGEITALRAAMRQGDNTTAVVLRLTQVSDGAGGNTDAYAEAAEYPCSYSPFPITPVERESATQARSMSAWKFIFPAGSDVRPTDRLQADGRLWEVVEAIAGSREIQRAVLCWEIK